MSDPSSSNTEARILQIEREAYRIYHEIAREMLPRMRAIEENLAMLWTLGPRKTATLSGQVRGCASQGFPGASVVVKDHASGVTLGTGVADSSGNYSISVNLDTDPQNLDVVATATGTHASKFGGPTTQNVPTAHVGGNTVSTITIPPASGWCCGGVNYFPGNCTWTFNIKGCNSAALAGATVSISAGTCTTGDGTGGTTLGQCTMSVPSGTYTVTVTPVASGYAAYSVSHSFVGNTTTNITLTPDASHVCVTVCPDPVPKTLFFTDSNGTHQLDWVAGNIWSCTYSASGATSGGVGCPTTGAMSVLVTFTLVSTPAIHIEWHIQGCGPAMMGCPFGSLYYGTNTSPANLATVDSTGGSLTCSPFSASVTVPTAWSTPPAGFCDAGGVQTPGGGGTLSITP